MTSPSETLTALIREHRKGFLKNYAVESYYKVNCGLCEEFAYEVHERFEHRHLAEVVYTEHYLDEFDNLDWNRLPIAVPDGLTRQEIEQVRLGGHCFLEMQGRWYDAECPEGVESFLDLPIFRRPIVLALRKKGLQADDALPEDVIPPPQCQIPNPPLVKMTSRLVNVLEQTL